MSYTIIGPDEDGNYYYRGWLLRQSFEPCYTHNRDDLVWWASLPEATDEQAKALIRRAGFVKGPKLAQLSRHVARTDFEEYCMTIEQCIDKVESQKECEFSENLKAALQ